ncbi:MAG: sigma-70 family RNA polymerase sigma factor [Saprospirales bacterium]|nr:sigma-70 family RNA polymerase sigma factor [Saprospirales bacterium]MBK8489645.1 sigma-70 family RNA polymerase sigma factor [Saprospirales bacterium]
MGKGEFNYKFLKMESMLMAFAFSLTKDEEAAQDLYQETAYKVFRYSNQFNPATNLKAWVMTIMKNTFINHYRRKKRQQVIFDNTGNDFLLNSAVTTTNQGEGRITMDEIQEAISELGDHLRIPFLMQYQGFQYEEIAEELAIPLGTVKSRIHFARKHLREQLKHRYQADSLSQII